jgi:hypothetical protein
MEYSDPVSSRNVAGRAPFHVDRDLDLPRRPRKGDGDPRTARPQSITQATTA